MIGEQVRVSRAAAESIIIETIGGHPPQAIRAKIWTYSYINLALLFKQSRDLQTDPYVTVELVIKNIHKCKPDAVPHGVKRFKSYGS